MALARGRRRPEAMNYWPGFVDALSTLLLVFIFLLSVFVMAQYFLARDVGGKDAALARLNKEIEELTSLLSLEKGGKAETQQSLASLSASLEQTRRERDALKQERDAGAGAAAANLDAEKQLSAKALSRVDLLNQQIAALRSQLAAIQEALSAQETKDKENQARIADLGSRLNVALAQKVQELARYRSDFFGRLREILGDRPGVKVVGDRFVLPSEVLFESGQATLTPEGRAEIDKIFVALTEVSKEIPPELPWVLRIDGHTDKRPITSSAFRSNWDLSAARSIAVTQYLVSKGFPPQHLLAGAFGEFQPIDDGASEDALRRNRRIELKITER
jgi:chemotaxis protein MotB